MNCPHALTSALKLSQQPALSQYLLHSHSSPLALAEILSRPTLGSLCVFMLYILSETAQHIVAAAWGAGFDSLDFIAGWPTFFLLSHCLSYGLVALDWPPFLREGPTWSSLALDHIYDSGRWDCSSDRLSGLGVRGSS